MPHPPKPPLFYPGTGRCSFRSNKAGFLASTPSLVVCILTLFISMRWPSLLGEEIPVVLGLAVMALSLTTTVQTHFFVRRLPAYEVDRVSIWAFGLSFVVWSVPAAAIGLCYFSPLSCSVAWGLVLGIAIGKRRGIQAGIVIGVVSCVAYWLFLFANPSQLEFVFIATAAAWHISYPFAIALATELRIRDLEYLKTVCEKCGYLREGLAEDARCPECGWPGNYHPAPRIPRRRSFRLTR